MRMIERRHWHRRKRRCRPRCAYLSAGTIETAVRWLMDDSEVVMNDTDRAAPQPKRRILVIDDDPGMTTLCRRVLEQTGEFTVREENDAMRAVETARAVQPHMIFLDCHLPGKDGPQISVELALDPELRSVPIVFLTGAVESGAAFKGRPVLLKPARGAQLIEACVQWALPPEK